MKVSVNVTSYTNVQSLTIIEMLTDEWKSRMTEYDTQIEQRINVKYEDLTDKITGINEWNSLSLCLSVGPSIDTLKLTHYWGVEFLSQSIG